MLHHLLAENDKKIDRGEPPTPQLFGQPFTLGSSNALSSPPLNDSVNSQLEAAENGLLPPQNANSLGLGPPPEFAQYEAEYFEVGYSDIVSHDSHLNSDGEALYRFLLSQASSPSHRIFCRGTHTETRQQSHQEKYTETVIDFDFCFDIVPNGPVEPIQWCVADDEPAYRGLMVREFEGPAGTGRQVAKGQKLKSYKQWKHNRSRLGLPPWVTEDTNITDGSTAHLDGLRSSKTLRQWTDEYCASPKYLKEFVYKKVLYGWDMEEIKSAIRSTIRSSPYNGSLQIYFIPYGSKVHIRPNNMISRMLSHEWIKFLSIILLIYPFIWLFKRFHSRGGGRWEVCGGAYPLKQWVPVEPGEEIDSDSLLPYNPPLNSSTLLTTTSEAGQPSARHMQTPTGPKKLLGMKEGEWFRTWEGVITRAVIGEYRSSIPLSKDVAR